ncbi:cellulase family glycosylhydrolase [Flavobacterium sp. Sd200]|uniref:beta-galactosidase n=1 Tax=Flavobacterium sp. Sd200 TaxID=2692211 RepID=UPI00136D4C2B|nr:beta-galactosidase [Flavobacterium sp. Sd200]MXN90837.1 cellulase family glycosylhydrolase [Flavobacterium sp. Sd200]
MKSIIKRYKVVAVLISLLWALPSNAQYKFDKPLYGAAYYSEYTPTDRLDKDVEMMKESGVSVVRIGESSWGIFESSEGNFQFEWMDRIVNKFEKAGIKVIFGTPTYSIPAWMAKAYPEVLSVKVEGEKSYYGIRQNMDFYNAKYRFFCERIIRKLMERYAKNPNVIGFQLDNELIARGVNNKDYFEGYKAYVKDKFKGDLKLLNKEWGLNYWGMNINTWDEFYERDGVTNPSYKLEWERWNRKALADFLNWQADIVKEYKRKDQFMTHCFMPRFYDIDHVESFRQMDYPAINVYNKVQDKQDGRYIAYAGDYMRTVAKGNYLITETNANGIGWDLKSYYPPYDGQLRQNLYSHLASGANMVEYWHWATLHYGQETYWSGLLGHDQEPNRVYNEFAKSSKELNKIGDKLVNLKKQNKAALLFSHDSYYGIGFMPFSNDDHYEFIKKLYQSLYDQNIEADVIPCDLMSDFSQYKLLIIPPLYVATDALLQKIDAFVKDGGEVVMLFKSGYCNEYNAVRAMKAPGPLRKACGFYYQEYSTIDKLDFKDNEFGVTKAAANSWFEFLVPETAKVLATVNHPFFGKWATVTENAYGKGNLVYIGTVPSDELLYKIVKKSAQRAGVLPLNGQYTFPVILREGTNDKGKKIHYLFNYSAEPKQVAYPYGKAKSLLDGRSINKNDNLEIPAWGVVITEE